ncbi:MAG: hypothetical protein ACOYKE_15545, partial [Ferruginibacter sp.]
RQDLFAVQYSQRFFPRLTEKSFVEIIESLIRCNRLPAMLIDPVNLGANDFIVSGYIQLADPSNISNLFSPIEPPAQPVFDSETLLQLRHVYMLIHSTGMPTDCETDFANWANWNYGLKENYEDWINRLRQYLGEDQAYICKPPTKPAYITLRENGVNQITSMNTIPRLCGGNSPLFPETPLDTSTCNTPNQLLVDIATEKYQLYVDSLANSFDSIYLAKCLSAKSFERFTVSYIQSEYHYTLYYYDQSGNLVKTVPPEGVDAHFGDQDFLNNVRQARDRVKNGEDITLVQNNLQPNHRLVTEYRYNTLNQVVLQQTPDAGESRFWYDKLGRLVLSQNAKQVREDLYSYTLYDDLGRIIEVGELGSKLSAPPNTRDQALLNGWLENKSAREITRTTYDKQYFEGDGTLCTEVLCQQNLRNRVATSAFYASGVVGVALPETHNHATHYSYDLHGNVDVLLQDFNSGTMKTTNNRFKRLEYNYDLISGKVNEVAYQPGKTDGFYHRYSYDAENRITVVETSQDRVVWEEDARYSYYKHGPLARTELGQLRVHRG